MPFSGNTTPVKRRSSVRSKPYDLRRRVLVKNFLKDQQPTPELHIPVRPPTPRIPYQLQYTQTDLESSDSTSKKQRPRKGINEGRESDPFSEDNPVNNMKEYSSNSLNLSEFTPRNDVLHMFSRRLRASENSNLRQPYKKVRRSSAALHHSKIRIPESQKKILLGSASPGKKGILKRRRKSLKNFKRTNNSEVALRSYPTFDKLNEIVSCDSVTYKKTIEALRSGRPRVASPISTPKSAIKNSRSSSLRKSVSKMLKRRPSEAILRPQVQEQNQEKKLCKRRSFVSKLFSPFSSEKASPTTSNNWITSQRPTSSITRSASLRAPSTPIVPKLARRTQSVRLRCVKLSNDAF